MNLNRKSTLQKQGEGRARKSVKIKFFEEVHKRSSPGNGINDFSSLAFGIYQILLIQKRIRQNKILDTLNPDSNFDFLWSSNSVKFEAFFQRISKAWSNESPYFIELEERYDWSSVLNSASRINQKSWWGVLTRVFFLFLRYFIIFSCDLKLFLTKTIDILSTPLWIP